MPSKKAGKDKRQTVAPSNAPNKKAKISASKAGAKAKASVQGYKKPGLLDCPIEIIGLISAALVRDSDELRTPQVIAADLLSLGACCKTLNTPEYTDIIWGPFCETCPPAPSCPLDMGMEIIEQLPLASKAPTNARTTRQSSRAGPQQSKVEPAASWEDVVMCLDQDPDMVSYEALHSLRRSLNIPYTSLMSPAALCAIILSRLPPKGCTKPLAAVLLLRREATTYLSKQQARSRYYITDAGFSQLTRVDAALGRAAGYRKYDIVKAASKRFKTVKAFRRRAEQRFQSRRYRYAAYYHVPPPQQPAQAALPVPAAAPPVYHIDIGDSDDDDDADEDEAVCPFCGNVGCRGPYA